MQVTSLRSIPVVFSLVLAVVAASCAPDDGAGKISAPSLGPSSALQSTTTEPDRRPVVAGGATDDMHVVASLGYPRDLLDRGRVNIKVDRSGDEDFVVLDRQLVADHFTVPPVEVRRSVIPPDGQVVALQTLLGVVVDCDDASPVVAHLQITYLDGAGTAPRRALVPVNDATTLDRIRLQACTLRRIAESNQIELRQIEVDDEVATADLVVTRTAGDERIVIDAIKGTVLFGITSPIGAGEPGRTLEPDASTITIPLTFVVNRCDPHAVAETTRKAGLDLYVSIDGAEAQRLDGPIEPIRADLETMLDRCKARNGN